MPAGARSPQHAATLVEPSWTRLIAEEPELAQIFDDPAVTTASFLAAARDLLSGYFAVEDPNRLEPADRELYVEAEVDGRLVIRGIIDRLDVSPAGDLRVVDYKTGGAPREAFEARAMFQLKFYALVLWRTRGVVPRVLRLMYLRDQEVCDFAPEAAELERFERTLLALWEAIELATRSGDFRAKPSRPVLVVLPPGPLPGLRRHPTPVPRPPHPDQTRRRARRRTRLTTPPPFAPPPFAPHHHSPRPHHSPTTTAAGPPSGGTPTGGAADSGPAMPESARPSAIPKGSKGGNAKRRTGTQIAR